MSKLITEDEKLEVIKITAGNDFSLNITVTELQDAETGVWSVLDLNAATDVNLYLVNSNGKRIKLDHTINSTGSLLADVIAGYLQTTTYGVTIEFKLNGRNRRTFSPCLIQLVNSTEEAGTTLAEYVNDVYNLNIRALIKMGGSSVIPQDDMVTLAYLEANYYDKDAIDDNYYDMREVNNILSSYVTTSYLDSTLETFESTITGEFIDTQELDESLSYYALTDDLNETLNSYVSHEQLNEMGYITINDVPEIDTSDLVSYEALQAMGYITINDVPEVDTSEFVSYAYLNNQNFVTAGQISDLGYVTQSQINSMSYATTNYVDTKVLAVEEQIPDVSNLVSQSSLETQLQPYAKTSDITSAGYVTQQYVENVTADMATTSYVNEKISGIDTSNLVSYIALNAMSYATTDNVASAVDGLVSYSALQSMSYATTSDVSTAINNIDMSSYVTSSALSNMGYITINDVPEVDTSDLVSYDYLDSCGYITVDDVPEIPDLSGFVTNQQLSAMSYVDQTSLSAMGYITAQDVPSQDMSAYVTHTELNNCGYITINDVPTPDLSSYVTTDELDAMGYITINDVPTPDLSSYVSYSALSAMSYTTESYVSSNYAKKTDVPVNGIKFVNDSPIAVSYLWAGTNAELANVQTQDPNTLYITTDDATTYVDLTPYALKSETAKVVTLTQDQYNALIATGPVDEYTIYLIIEQQ